MSTPAAPPPLAPFVCWSVADETEPVRIVAVNGMEAAKLFVLRDQATATRHDNDWSPSSVLVVNYVTGASFWFTVKVQVEASQ